MPLRRPPSALERQRTGSTICPFSWTHSVMGRAATSAPSRRLMNGASPTITKRICFASTILASSSAALFDRARQRPGRQEKDQHQAAVGVARAIDRDVDRREREEESGQQAGGGAEAALNQMVEERDRGDALQSLGDQHAEGVKAEELDARDLNQEGDRRLVHGDEPGRVERVVEEVVPAEAHAPDAGRVVLVPEAVLVQAPEPERRRRGENREQPEPRRRAPDRLHVVYGRPAGY